MLNLNINFYSIYNFLRITQDFENRFLIDKETFRKFEEISEKKTLFLKNRITKISKNLLNKNNIVLRFDRNPKCFQDRNNLLGKIITFQTYYKVIPKIFHYL